MDINSANYPDLVINKSEGFNESEKKLISLGYNSFLRLWSYPNLFRNHANGQELCDLLVVFENDIIIFSDKNCAYGSNEDPRVNWNRWYKKAINASCKQLLGAKKWITDHPDRICLDAECQIPLPFSINITEKTKFHLIAVARGATAACIDYYGGGDGGLILDTDIIREKLTAKGSQPFQIGLYSNNEAEFVHIFDDVSYQIILRELDTIRDFTFYLDVRKTLLLKKHIIASSETELLAIHLDGLTRRNKAVLQSYIKEKADILCFEGGKYEELTHSKQYKEWKKKLEISYFWDHLLSKTFEYIESGKVYFTSTPTIEAQQTVFHWMAGEDRLFRYICSDAILELIKNTSDSTFARRHFNSPSHPDLCYLIMLMPLLKGIQTEEYRETRRKALSDYCYIAKHRFPKYNHIVGIAHEANDGEYSSEDFVYLDASDWDEEKQTEAEHIYDYYKNNGILTDVKETKKSFFPPTRMKGRDRNLLCPCGSGKKYKKCCGRLSD